MKAVLRAREERRKEIERVQKELDRLRRELIAEIEKFSVENYGVGLGDTTTSPSEFLKGTFQQARNKYKKQAGIWDYTTARARGALHTFAIFPATIKGHEYSFVAEEDDPQWFFSDTRYSVLGVYPDYKSARKAMSAFRKLRKQEIADAESRMMEIRISGYLAIVSGGTGIAAIRSGRVVTGLIDVGLTADQAQASIRTAYTGEQQRLGLSYVIGKAGEATGLLSEDNERSVGDFIANYGTLAWDLGQIAGGSQIVRNGLSKVRSGLKNAGTGLKEIASRYELNRHGGSMFGTGFIIPKTRSKVAMPGQRDWHSKIDWKSGGTSSKLIPSVANSPTTSVSKQLGDNLAGSTFGGDAMRHLGFDAHHIVPWDSPRGARLRQFMMDKGFTLDEIKTGTFNGVWLPASARKGGLNKGVKELLYPPSSWHKGAPPIASKHSNATMNEILRRISPLEGNKNGIMDEIRRIGLEMQDGVFLNQ